MLEFIRMVTTWYGHIDNLSTTALLRLFKGGAMRGQALHPRQTANSFAGERNRGGRHRHELTTPGPGTLPDGRTPRVQKGVVLLLGGAGGGCAGLVG